MNIAIIGAGAWGTALAIHFARQQHNVTLYTNEQEHAQAMRQTQSNTRYLPSFRLPENLCTALLADGIANTDLILLVTPTAALRSVLQNTLTSQCPNTPILAACKGFERNTGLLPYQILTDVLPNNPHLGVLSGPSFAQELAQGLPCAVCIAGENHTWINSISGSLNTSTMRLYANYDPIGVGVGGAVKNVMAIATGVVDGMEYGLNARAALITRGLAEMTRLAICLGAKEATMMGLAGMGDLILTCTGSLSRNRQVGLKLAEGKALAQILQELGHVAEGVNTVDEVVLSAQKHQVDMPITHILKQLLDGQIQAAQAVQTLMLREPKAER